MEYCDLGSLIELINNAWEKDGCMGSLTEHTIKLIGAYILLGWQPWHPLVPTVNRSIVYFSVFVCFDSGKCIARRIGVSAQQKHHPQGFERRERFVDI